MGTESAPVKMARATWGICGTLIMLAMCRGRDRLDVDDRDNCGNVHGGWADGVRNKHVDGAHDRAAYGRT